jgi:hypothetical protein
MYYYKQNKSGRSRNVGNSTQIFTKFEDKFLIKDLVILDFLQMPCEKISCYSLFDAHKIRDILCSRAIVSLMCTGSYQCASCSVLTHTEKISNYCLFNGYWYKPPDSCVAGLTDVKIVSRYSLFKVYCCLTTSFCLLGLTYRDSLALQSL